MAVAVGATWDSGVSGHPAALDRPVQRLGPRAQALRAPLLRVGFSFLMMTVA